MNRLIIVGASGHGKVVADIAKKCGYSDIVFLDDDETIKECFGYSVIGPVTMLDKIEGDVIVSIGNASIRKRIMEQYSEKNYPVLIHPNAVIADNVCIGAGTVIMAGAVVNPDAKVGKGCILNTCSSIDHDCIIEDYVHVSVGAHLGGTVLVGEATWIGAGATISNNIDICSKCMIGAGSVVIRNISDSGTYIGVPAKKMKDRG